MTTTGWIAISCNSLIETSEVLPQMWHHAKAIALRPMGALRFAGIRPTPIATF